MLLGKYLEDWGLTMRSPGILQPVRNADSRPLPRPKIRICILTGAPGDFYAP